MKVLHVIARMNVGGTATYLLNLLEGLDNAGVEAHLAVGYVPKNEREESKIASQNYWRIKHLSREISPYKDFRSRVEIKKLIEKINPDIIHSHTFKAGALVRSLTVNVPIIHTFHGHHLYDPDYGKFKGWMLRIIEKSLARKSTKIVTIGKRIGLELRQAKIGIPSQYVSIPPGVARPRLFSRSEIEKEIGIQKGINILWMGRLTHVKRPDRMIEIAKRFPRINFVVAGEGELREILEIQAPSNVKFLGIQDPNKMWSIADLVLLTSDSEGMPLTLIEGQIAGIPGIATNVGSVEEILIHGKTGLLAKPELEDLAQQIEKLTEDSKLREELARNARRRAEKIFSIGYMTTRHIDLYQEVLEETKV